MRRFKEPSECVCYVMMFIRQCGVLKDSGLFQKMCMFYISTSRSYMAKHSVTLQPATKVLACLDINVASHLKWLVYVCEQNSPH